MQSGGPNLQFAFPTPEGWQRNLLIGLLVLYVVELSMPYLGIELGFLAWQPLAVGFEWWQPVTHFFVHARPDVFGVLLSLVVLYFFLPAVGEVLDWDAVGQAVIAGAVGGTLVPFALDASGLLSMQPAGGWHNLALTLPVLFGLARPDRQILILVFPAPAQVFVWGSLVIALLSSLTAPSLSTTEMLGVWLGTFGWWHLAGPGRRRRNLRRMGANLEREVRFTVLEGGRSNDGDNRDDTVH